MGLVDGLEDLHIRHTINAPSIAFITLSVCMILSCLIPLRCGPLSFPFFFPPIIWILFDKLFQPALMGGVKLELTQVL